MAFTWWKCRFCLGWNWTKNRAKCVRCHKENGDLCLGTISVASTGTSVKMCG